MKKLPAVSTGQVQLLQTVLIAGVALYVFSLAKKATVKVVQNAEQVIDSTKEIVTEDLNPAHNQNIVNRGFSWLYEKLPGTSDSLGSDIYDLFHPNEGFQ